MVKTSFCCAIKRGVECIPKVDGSPALGDLVHADHVPIRTVGRDSFLALGAAAAVAAFAAAIGPAAFVPDPAVGDRLDRL